MSALICGSLAFDTIMVFPDQFKNHILPDKVHILNVSFLVPRMPRVLAAARQHRSQPAPAGRPADPDGHRGFDFGPYREYFEGLGIDLSRVRVIDELFTPQAFITTDHADHRSTRAR